MSSLVNGPSFGKLCEHFAYIIFSAYAKTLIFRRAKI